MGLYVGTVLAGVSSYISVSVCLSGECECQENSAQQ